MLAILRDQAGIGIPHPALTALVDELHALSPDFARFWADYRLFEHTHGVKRFFSEVVGELKVNYETLPLPGDHGQTVIVYSADPGSASEERLRMLTGATADAGRR
jgi:hypothetical protein